MSNYKTEWLRDNGKRYLVWLLIATVFAIACWFLSQWQLSRLDEVKTANALITKNYEQPATDINDLAQPQSFDPANEYRRVELTGFYAKDFFLIRNRPLNGQPGFEQFAAFITQQNQVVFIDRGWYPTGSNQDLPDKTQQLQPNCDPITIVGHIRTAQPDSEKDYPLGQIGNASPLEAIKQKPAHFGHMHLPCMSQIAPTYFESVYLSLEAETPALTTPNPPAPNQRPELSEGNHLSYAMQWVLFALMAFIALFYMIRQELLLKKEQTDKTFKRKVKKTRSKADEDFEDSAS